MGSLPNVVAIGSVSWWWRWWRWLGHFWGVSEGLAPEIEKRGKAKEWVMMREEAHALEGGPCPNKGDRGTLTEKRGKEGCG